MGLPPETFDLVADIFSQFSAPDDRARKWSGMAHAVRPGGHLILQGTRPISCATEPAGRRIQRIFTRKTCCPTPFRGLISSIWK